MSRHFYYCVADEAGYLALYPHLGYTNYLGYVHGDTTVTPGSNQSTFAPVEGERECVVLVSRQGGRVGQELGNEVANQYLRNEGTALALQTAKSTRS